MKTISPIIDDVFKELFGTPSAKGRLKHLINSIFSKLQLTPVTSIKLKNPILQRWRLNQKLVTLDILATDQLNRHLQIEIQLIHHRHLTKRMSFNNARLLSSQVKIGAKWEAVSPVISIWLMDDPVLPEEGFLAHYMMRNHSGKILNNIQNVIIINMKQAPKAASTSDKLSKWVYLLKEWNSKQFLSDILEDKEFQEAIKVLKHFAITKRRYHYLVSRENFKMEQSMQIQSAFEDGIDEGHQSGHQVGVQEGKQVGLKEGKQVGGVEAKVCILLSQLEIKFGYSIIDDKKNVGDIKDVAVLDRALRKMLTADSIDEVFN